MYIHPISHVALKMEWLQFQGLPTWKFQTSLSDPLWFDGHETRITWWRFLPSIGRPSAELVSPSPSASGGSDQATALAAGATRARPGLTRSGKHGKRVHITMERSTMFEKINHNHGHVSMLIFPRDQRWPFHALPPVAPSWVWHPPGRRPRHPCPSPGKHPPPIGPSWSALRNVEARFNDR